jgi:hypothetical protein
MNETILNKMQMQIVHAWAVDLCENVKYTKDKAGFISFDFSFYKEIFKNQNMEKLPFTFHKTDDKRTRDGKLYAKNAFDDEQCAYFRGFCVAKFKNTSNF